MTHARSLLTLFLLGCQASAEPPSDAVAKRIPVTSASESGLQISPAPPPTAKAIAAAVHGALQHGHYDPPAVDDTLSIGWFDAYLDTLDPNRLYFTAADIQALSRHRTTLDDDLMRPEPELALAWRAHKLFVRRIHERVDHAQALLARNDFTFDDPDAALDLDREDVPWPTKAELDTAWDQRVAEQLLRMELNGEARERSIQRLHDRFERIRSDVTSMEDLDVLETFLGSLSRLYDPHTLWFKPITKQNFDIEMSDKLTGIGARLQVDEGYTKIVDLIAGGPASKGEELHAGDRIVAVAQGDGEPVDVVDMRLDRVVQLIRGEIGTTVTLTVIPHDAIDVSSTREIRIVRDEVKIADAAAKGEVHEVRGQKVGVIDVPSFYVDTEGQRAGGDYGSTATDIAAILADFEQQQVDVVLLDLRGNGGGALDQALETTGLFLPGGPIVQVRDRKGGVDVLRDPSREVAWKGPLVVLTSELSASASEILAAAIQDHGRGLVVGATQTHGKGTVQNLLGLGRYLARVGQTEAAAIAGALKYTSHMFYRIDGASTQVEGVKPDVELPSVYEGLDVMESDLDNPLPWHAIEPASYRRQPLAVDLQALRDQSRARVSASMEFAFLQEDLMRRAADKDDFVLSLHKDTRTAEIERNKLIAEARKTARTMAGSDPEDPPDAILVEATEIAADYAEAAGG